MLVTVPPQTAHTFANDGNVESERRAQQQPFVVPPSADERTWSLNHLTTLKASEHGGSAPDVDPHDLGGVHPRLADVGPSGQVVHHVRRRLGDRCGHHPFVGGVHPLGQHGHLVTLGLQAAEELPAHESGGAGDERPHRRQPYGSSLGLRPTLGTIGEADACSSRSPDLIPEAVSRVSVGRRQQMVRRRAS